MNPTGRSRSGSYTRNKVTKTIEVNTDVNSTKTDVISRFWLRADLLQHGILPIPGECALNFESLSLLCERHQQARALSSQYFKTINYEQSPEATLTFSEWRAIGTDDLKLSETQIEILYERFKTIRAVREEHCTGVYFYEFILFLALQFLFASVRTNPPRNELEDFYHSPAAGSIDASPTRNALDLHYHFFGGGRYLPRKPRLPVTRSCTSDETSGGNTARNLSGNVVVGGGRKHSPMPEGGESLSNSSAQSNSNPHRPDSLSSGEESDESSSEEGRQGKKASAERKRRNKSAAVSPRLSESEASPPPTSARSQSVDAPIAATNDKATKRNSSTQSKSGAGGPKFKFQRKLSLSKGEVPSAKQTAEERRGSKGDDKLASTKERSGSAASIAGAGSTQLSSSSANGAPSGLASPKGIRASVPSLSLIAGGDEAVGLSQSGSKANWTEGSLSSRDIKRNRAGSASSILNKPGNMRPPEMTREEVQLSVVKSNLKPILALLCKHNSTSAAGSPASENGATRSNPLRDRTTGKEKEKERERERENKHSSSKQQRSGQGRGDRSSGERSGNARARGGSGASGVAGETEKGASGTCSELISPAQLDFLSFLIVANTTETTEFSIENWATLLPLNVNSKCLYQLDDVVNFIASHLALNTYAFHIPGLQQPEISKSLTAPLTGRSKKREKSEAKEREKGEKDSLKSGSKSALNVKSSKSANKEQSRSGCVSTQAVLVSQRRPLVIAHLYNDVVLKCDAASVRKDHSFDPPPLLNEVQAPSKPSVADGSTQIKQILQSQFLAKPKNDSVSSTESRDQNKSGSYNQDTSSISTDDEFGSSDLDSPNIEIASSQRSKQTTSTGSRGGHSSHSGGGGSGHKTVARGGSTRAHSHAEVHVQEVAITDVRNSAVYLLLQMGNVRIKACRGSTIVLGAVGGIVSIEGCAHCKVIAITHSIQISQLVFGPYNSYYSSVGRHLENVGISPLNANRWNQPILFSSVVLCHVESQLQMAQLDRDKSNAKSLRDPNAVDYFFDIIMEDELNNHSKLYQSKEKINEDAIRVSKSRYLSFDADYLKSIYRIQDPKSFSIFSVPVELRGETKENPIELPEEYSRALVEHKEAWAKLTEKISKLNTYQKESVRKKIEEQFEMWLRDSGNIQHVVALVANQFNNGEID